MRRDARGGFIAYWGGRRRLNASEEKGEDGSEQASQTDDIDP